MALQLYFKNTKTQKRYRVVRMDKERKKIILAGKLGEFEEDYDKERFVKMGYELVKEDDAEQAA